MKKIQMHIEIEGDQAWAFTTRSFPKSDGAPLHERLQWILEQLNMENCTVQIDEMGDAVSIVIGKDAAPEFESPVLENAERHFVRRNMALNIAGLFARSREEGADPKFAGLAEEARSLSAQHGGHLSTDIHYAFELLKILERIQKKTFVFKTPAIAGRVGPDISRLVGEATRAYLFGLNRACISMCRALIEGALNERVPYNVVREEQYQADKGYLEALIDASATCGFLNDRMRKTAHLIRDAGNKALHGKEPADSRAWEVLSGARAIVEYLCSENVRG